jgi:hypothetical protein
MFYVYVVKTLFIYTTPPTKGVNIDPQICHGKSKWGIFEISSRMWLDQSGVETTENM